MSEEFLIRDASGRCKCCLNETDLKNLWDDHEIEGVHEKYGDMLNDCFEISWKPTVVPELICAICVLRLKEAINFKREIMATQELLKEGVYIKIEEEEIADSEMIKYENVEYLDGDNDEDATPDVPSSSQIEVKIEDHEPRKTKWPRKKIKSERRKTYKQYSTEDLNEAVQLVWSGEMRCADAALLYRVPSASLLAKIKKLTKGDNDVDDLKETMNEKHNKLIEEIKILLQYTNAIPFKTKTNRYYCFYCSTEGQHFEDPEDLRNHMYKKHSNCIESIHKLDWYMKPLWRNEVIKLDVQNLECIDCRVLLPDWNNMFVHFAEVHRIGFDEAYTKAIPYALTSELNCILCHENFHNYGHLDAHMNNHYSNHICDKCGDTFLAASRLDKHLKVHKTGNYPCQQCNKVFTLEKYRSKHFALVHKHALSAKCLYCPEKFVDPLQRHAHITEKHKEKVKTLTCEVCGKMFTWKPYFLAHMRKRHSTIKDYACKYCPKKFMMPYELRDHEVKHTREKKYTCEVCNEKFVWRLSMRKHMKTHEIILGV